MKLHRLWSALLPACLLMPLTGICFAQSPAAKQGGPAGGRPVPLIQSDEDEGDEVEGPDYLRRRDEWFYNQRAYPLGRIPAGARLKALEHMDRMIGAQKLRLSSAPKPKVFPLNQSMWVPIGPAPINSGGSGNFSGRVTALAADLKNNNIVYLGAAEGGVWKTTDGGTTWTPLTDQQPSLAIGSLAIDPNSCGGASCTTIYEGTGEENFSGDAYYGAGIFKSADGGANWNLVCTTPGASCPFVGGPFGPNTGGTRVGSIAVQPGNSSVILAAMTIFSNGTAGGIFRSIDGGATWTQVISGAVGTTVVFDPTSVAANNAAIAYATMGNIFGEAANGIYKSTDSGTTWTKLAGGLPTVNLGRITLGFAPSTNGATATIYGAIADSSTTSSNLLGVFKTTNAGTNWSALSAPDFCTAQCWYDIVLAVDPNDPLTVFAGGSATANGTLVRSTDGGTTWANISGTGANKLHVDHHAIAFSGGKMYAGNDGGVWSGTNYTSATAAGSVTFSNLNSTLAITQFYRGMVAHPYDDNVAMGGTQDNGFVRTRDLTTQTWDDVTCGDGGDAQFDPAVPSTVYLTCTVLNPPYVRKSFLNGDPGTYFGVVTGINAGDSSRTSFIPTLAMDRNNPAVLYTPSFRVYQTRDGANTWTVISNDLTRGGNAYVFPITVQQSNSNVVVAGTSDGRVWQTVNAMATSQSGIVWTEITGTGLPSRFVTHVEMDKSDANTVFASFSGYCFGGDTKGHLFKTSNANLGAAATWSDISGSATNCAAPTATDLPNVPINNFGFNRQASKTNQAIVVGTDIGVFQTADGGATWSVLDPALPGSHSLPRVVVLSVAARDDLTVRVGTHGRSAFILQLPFTAPPGGSTIAAIHPATTPVQAAGGAGIDVAIDGLSFTGSTGILWNNSSTGVTIKSQTASQLVVHIDNSLLLSAVAATIFQTDPAPTGNGNFIFVVTNPTPSPSLLSPGSVTAGQSVLLTVTGTNFVCGANPSLIVFNGVNNQPDAGAGNCSSTTLKSTIPGAETNLAPGVVHVTVSNPQPGGGPIGGFFNFTINAPARKKQVQTTSD